MTRNSQTNNLIKWAIIISDFLLMFMLLKGYELFRFPHWSAYRIRIFFIMSLVALLISEYYYPPMIHKRLVTSETILQRLFKLALTQTALAIVLMKALNMDFIGGTVVMGMGGIFLFLLLIDRILVRILIRRFRRLGRNTRHVSFVGSDVELLTIYNRLKDEASKGYIIQGYYADDDFKDLPEGVDLVKKGTLQDLLEGLQNHQIDLGDEIYVSLFRTQKDTIRKISGYCDQNVVRFYYVPVSVETLGIDLKRELLDDIEIFTTYENPLQNPVNKFVKRMFDVLLASLFLIISLPIWPIVWLVMKLQSPGPLFFAQARTGLDGKEFMMYKFRSMHVNDDADKVQATEHDPRKYPFGNFMRKANIDELPQFWNVLKGDMSIVGPRPHMLLHTAMYSQLIDKYMVRHFVKPGVTGWAQVTGFRGETKELWQMEGRVKRDIWYMEHWSIWLDIRIIWMTVKTIFVHDKKAY